MVFSEEEGNLDTVFVEGHVKMDAETGSAAFTSQGTKDCQQPPEAGTDKEGSILRAFRESMALPT